MKQSVGILSVAAAFLAAATTFAGTIYVATTGNDASANPYDTATPLKTVDKALTAAVDGDAIYITAGTYDENNKNWVVTKAVTISGEGWDKTILKRCKIQLNNAALVVQELRITGWTGGGTIEFVNGGAGGTVRRCDISGNTRTSTAGTGVQMYCGNLIDCVITNNVNGSGGAGVGLNVSASDDCLIENCLIADNSTGYGGNCGGLYITQKVNGKTVTVRHCTIAGNLGGDTGGLYINGNVNVEMEDCIIADNGKLTDPKAANTEDAYLGWTAGYSRTFNNCLIAKCPTYNAGYVFNDACLLNAQAGFTNPYAGDYSVGPQSVACGAASDGTDIGYYQTVHGEALSAGCYAEVDRGLDFVATALIGTCLNASGAVTYEWDLDLDGTYELSGPSVQATFTTPGWQSVGVKATCGGAVSETVVDHVAYVCPKTTYVWTQSPNPSFPYATWETASHEPHPALRAVLDGGRLQFTNEAFTITKYLQIYRAIEMCGTGKDNNSIVASVDGWGSVPKKTDVNATGTAIQRASTDVQNLRVHNTGALIHSIAFGPGRPNVVCMYGESVISNCVVRFGHYTSGTGVGVWANAGLVTHCVISNSFTGGTGSGGEVYLEGTAKLRNSLVTGGMHNNTTAPGCKGSVYAKGNAEVSNCTIVGNTAGYGAGLYTDSATVRILNNIIRDNYSTCDPSSHPDWYDNTGTGIYSNNCMAVAHNAGDGTVTAAPRFPDGATGLDAWTFPADSPCVNAGWPVDWATEDATDLFGNRRVQGAAIDIGCFEADMSVPTCGIAANPTEATGPTNVTFSVVVIGTTLSPDAQYLWDFDGDGETDALGAVVPWFCDEGFHSARLRVIDGGEEVFNVEGDTKLVTIYPSVIYFDTANTENAAFPYNTPATAAAKMSDVLAVAKSGVEIRVLEGDHVCDAQILLNIKATLRAADGVTAKPRLIRKFDASSFVAIGNPETLIQGLFFDANKTSPQTVVVNDGVVRDCVIANGSYTTGTGIGVFMNGGLVDRCEIVGHRGTATDDPNASGAAVVINGTAAVRNSLIRGNYVDTATAGRRGGVVAVRGDGVLENCTLTGNTNRFCSVVCAVGGGTIRNCIIFGNEGGVSSVDPDATQWPAFTPYEVVSSSGSNRLVVNPAKANFIDYNCYQPASGIAFGEHDVLADPLFNDAADGDYTFGNASPCLGKGINQDWMDGALDLVGGKRLFGAKVDIGATECQIGMATMMLIQ